MLTRAVPPFRGESRAQDCPRLPSPAARRDPAPCHPLHTAPTILRRPTTHSTSLAPRWPVAANSASALWRLSTTCSPLAHRELEQMCFEIQTALYLRLRQQASVNMPAWYQWATPPAAAMRPACVVPMQYFLCDRNAVTFTLDDTMPTTSAQTSTIVLPIQLSMRKSLPETSDGLAGSSCIGKIWLSSDTVSSCHSGSDTARYDLQRRRWPSLRHRPPT
jgi:hypothetical protein